MTRKDHPAQLVIELPETQEFAMLLADFDGLESLKVVDDTKPGMHTMYEGFSRLIGMTRKSGAIRLSLEKN